MFTNTIRTILRLQALTALALVLTACGAAPETPFVVPEGAGPEELVDLKACTYEAHKIKYKAECGTLVAPENRSDPNSGLIAVPVIRVPALNGSPGEPIFFLQGGPGGTNLHFQYLAGLVDDHDIVQVGYRGVEGSIVLDCPEISDAIRSEKSDMLSDAALDRYAAASAQCANRLEAEGVDLSGYTMTEVIDDVEATREALGYDRIHLLGESYGTRLQILYEMLYPESLGRVAMYAVNPPGHFRWKPEDVDAQLEDYARLCALDAACSGRTDDLMASLRRVSENMPDRWLFLPVDGGGVKMVTFFMLMESIQPPEMPVPLTGPAAIDMWLAAERGDASGMALATMSRNMFIPEMLTWGDMASKAASGGDFAGAAGESRSTFYPESALLGSPATLFHWGMMRGWPQYLIPEQYLPLQPIDVETLLVSGSIDFSTPPQFATRELLPYLNHGEQVILKDLGHTETFWNIQDEARTRLLTTFFDTGEVDSSLYEYQAVNFDAGLGWPGLAKVALGLVILIGVLLAVLIWVIFRAARRAARRKE